MKTLIQSIIQNDIPKNCVFDVHSIIEYLIQYHSDVYLSTHQNNWTTEFYHSEISKKIASFEGNIITRQGESWSRNIHYNFSTNKCWVKL